MQKKRFDLPSNRVIYSQTMEYIEKEKTFLLFKGNNLDAFIESSSYASEKGFNLIGIDMKTPGLKDHLKSLKKHGQRRFGVFCVSSKKEARIAINAGASFIFSTHCDRGIIRRCNRETVFNSIGCLTPSELAAANEFGARTISIFPCNKMGGVSWFVFLREIFPKLRFIPTDKMNPSEASRYLREGAYAVAPIIDLEITKYPIGLIEDFKTIK
ncbi:MAG TPA: bifunctional 4-hydroxy-2-oxoglutarate aldolase/2-dehydro-3-deoxy-phosphogluconate aldolase [Thermodesulfobacteriota bacterium]|jgi:2-dehydro-3-deoxyphosphogluconate aldolase/(4S)-4-hydroxy-2-oxoglutarate aldolase